MRHWEEKERLAELLTGSEIAYDTTLILVTKEQEEVIKNSSAYRTSVRIDKGVRSERDAIRVRVNVAGRSYTIPLLVER